VLAGGAISGFSLLGAIQYLQDKNILCNIDKFIGTSIGAIIGYLICIGYAPVELMVVLCRNNFLDKLSQFDVLNVIHGGGAASFSIVQEVIEKLTIQKISRFITMGELKELYGKTLVCCTYNQTKDCVEYIGSETHPNIPCLVALRMSANLPFLFEPFHYDGNVYIDGGIVDNLPISALEENDKAIALRLLTSKNNNESVSFMDDLMDIMTIPTRHLEKFRLEKVNHQCVVVVLSTKVSFLKFNVDKTEKFDLFSFGYNTMREHFNDL
jgi:predicted acylesterase/phospholipase RssA